MPIAQGEFGYLQQSSRYGVQSSSQVGQESASGVSIDPTVENEHKPSSGEHMSLDQHMSAMSQDESQQARIARIKQEQRLQWLSHPASESMHAHQPSTATPTPRRALLPAAIITADQTPAGSNQVQGHEQLGSSIVRPRSALHAGDFRQRQDSEHPPDTPRPSNVVRQDTIGGLPRTSWFASPTGHGAILGRLQTQGVQQPSLRSAETLHRHRAASYSALPSGYIPRPPTSPLVMQSNSTDLDSSDESNHVTSADSDKSYRRHTFSPSSLQTFSPSQHNHNYNGPFGVSPPMFRREVSAPTQAHQPRRSLSSVQSSVFDDQYSTPSARTRRPSTSEHPSLQHAPLVGRYEESILRGRMSTLPSRPVDFVAQIGVLGRGKCKASLRCPPHVTVPFPAVFYDYKQARDRFAPVVDGPSPYVGQIDLENNLKPDRAISRLQREPSPGSDAESNAEDLAGDRHNGSTSQHHRRRQHRRPPKGSYRIPQQGQIQIVIKNPNKTAVKLFLVPYDLTGMSSGQKTFIRQRSYSWGPVIDMPLSARKNLGTERPEAALSSTDDPKDRPVLRYLIHLHICCPSRGRYFLYKNIRVVFANRAPDGKEKLRVETQLPEPRFSAYKDDVVSAKLGLPLPILESTTTTRPTTPVQRATSVGEYTQHLQNALHSHHSIQNSKSTASEEQPFTRFEFSRLQAFDHRSVGFGVESSSLSTNLSPKSTELVNTNDAMSWKAEPGTSEQQASGMLDGTRETPEVGELKHSRSMIPRPVRGGGLLALQLRDWAGQIKPPKPS